MSRPPKPPHQRRNRNPLRAGEWRHLGEGFKGPIPSCAGFGLSKATMTWWRSIWRSPMANEWLPSDVPALLELAVLRQWLLGGKHSLGPEVRLRSDQFGLTPAGRQARRWMIAKDRAEVRKLGAVTKLHIAVDDTE